MKIVIDDKIPFIQGAFESIGVEVVYASGAKIDAQCVKDADALIVRTRTQCNEDLLKDSKVRFIATATIGYDHIDTDYCAKANIQWQNAPGCNAMSVQQYIASALCYWAKRDSFSLQNKTLGIIGCGNTGKAVLKFAQAIGLHVLINDPPRMRNEKNLPEYFVDLPTLLSQSDIITCHVPLSNQGEDATLSMVNQSFFEQCQRGAYFVNASRGEIVDENALLSQITQKKLLGVILDVWNHEPHIDLTLLQKIDCGTPHIAGYSADGKVNGTEMSVHAVSRFFNLGLDTWRASPLPLPENAILDLNNFVTLQDALNFVIQACYHIVYDSDLLRENPEQFEKLRGDYRIRREYKAFTLQNTPPEFRQVFEMLGFQCQ